jgi:hypothetical protein
LRSSIETTERTLRTVRPCLFRDNSVEPESKWNLEQCRREGTLHLTQAILRANLKRREEELTTEQELREKLRKIAALYEGATSVGERDAANAALNRVRAALSAAEKSEPVVEMTFRLPDRWSRQLFLALCRRYGLKPFRYPRQRYSTVVLRAPRKFINVTLWPEYLEIAHALEEYLNRATQRIIQEEVFGDAAEAEERAGSPKDALAIGPPLEREA